MVQYPNEALGAMLDFSRNTAQRRIISASNNSPKIIHMFTIKDNFIYQKDFCLIFKDFSRKNLIQVLFNANVSLQGLFKTVRAM